MSSVCTIIPHLDTRANHPCPLSHCQVLPSHPRTKDDAPNSVRRDARVAPWRCTAPCTTSTLDRWALAKERHRIARGRKEVDLKNVVLLWFGCGSHSTHGRRMEGWMEGWKDGWKDGRKKSRAVRRHDTQGKGKARAETPPPPPLLFPGASAQSPATRRAENDSPMGKVGAAAAAPSYTTARCGQRGGARACNRSPSPGHEYGCLHQHKPAVKRGTATRTRAGVPQETRAGCSAV